MNKYIGDEEQSLDEVEHYCDRDIKERRELNEECKVMSEILKVKRSEDIRKILIEQLCYKA